MIQISRCAITSIFVFLILIGTFVSMFGAVPTQSDEVTLDLLGRYESRYLEGLKNLDFYETAEFYCQRKINQPKTDPAMKIGYGRVLLQVITDRLLASKPEDRNSIYVRLDNVGKTWRRSEIQSPLQPLFWIQVMVSDLKYAELLRLEAEIRTRNNDLEKAKDLFRKVDEQTREKILALQNEIRTADTKTSQQYLSYSRYLQLYQALALKNLAICYPEGSPERTDLLQQTVAILNQLLGIATNDSVFWNAWIASASSNRFLGQWDRAAAILTQLLDKNPPEPVLVQAKIEAVELAIARNEFQGALTLVENAGISPETSAEFELVKLKLYLKLQKTDEQTELWKSRIMEQAILLEKTFGPYWEHRAQLLMTQFEDVLQGDIQLPEQRGNAALRSGNESEAIRLFDLAAQSAGKDNPAEAFRLSKKAGLVVHQQSVQAEKSQSENLRSLHEEALKRFRNIAMNDSANPEAETVHLWSLFHAGKLVEAGQLAISDYVALLEEHFLTWPQSGESESLRVDAAKLLENQGQWQNAIRQLAPVTNRSAHAIDAIQTAKRCFDVLLNMSGTPLNDRENLAREAARWFAGRVSAARESSSPAWNEADGECLLESARYQIAVAGLMQQAQPTDPQKIRQCYQAAEDQLKTGMTQYPDASESWKSTAESLLACTLAGQGRLDKAVQNLKNINRGEPAALLAILANLEQMAKTATPDIKQFIANMQLVVIESVQSQNESLTAEQNFELERLHAVVLADLGKVQESIDRFRTLLNSNPNNTSLYVSLGRVLMSQNDQATLEAARKIWQHVEKHSPPQSESWWEAKEAMLQIEIRLGNRQNAQKALELLEILYPDLGGTARKQRMKQFAN